MKKLITILVIALSLKAGLLQAQVPNPGFENLNSDGSISNWGNVYLFAVMIDSNGVSYQDSIVFDNTFYAPTTDAHSGSYAIEMRNAYNYTSNTGIAGSASADTDSVFSGWSAFEMVPIQSTPTDLSFYYKYFPVNNDSASARLTVIDAMGNQIGESLIILNGTVNNYSLATAPVIYTSPGVAAYYVLNFSTFYTSNPGVDQPGFGTRFLVDDVSLNVTTGISSTNNPDAFQLYPNPANDFLNITKKSSEALDYKIYNIFGQIAGQGELPPFESRIDLESLTNGFYYLELLYKDKIEKLNFVVNR